MSGFCMWIERERRGMMGLKFRVEGVVDELCRRV